jgi:PAS domain S-box-containing protein
MAPVESAEALTLLSMAVSVGLLAVTAALWRSSRARSAGLDAALEEVREGQRIARDELRHREAVLAAIPDLLFEIDQEGRYLTVKASREELLAAPAATLLGRRVDDVLPPSAAATVHEALAGAAAAGSDYGRVIELQLPTGVHWFELSVARRSGGDGVPPTFVVLSRDITARRRVQAAADEQRRETEIILRTAIDGFMVVDRSSRIVEANDSACAILGYERHELLGMPVARIEATMGPADVEAMTGRIVREGRVRFSTRHRRKDGRLVEIEASAQHVPVGDGRIVSFFRDVTAQRQAEEQLRQSQKMEAVGQLAGGVAHDFNNLLTVILTAGGFALRAAPPSGQLHEDIEAMCVAARKAQDVTRQLLAFSHQLVLEPKVTDLNALVREVAPMLGRLLDVRVAVDLRLQPGSLGSLVDPGKIQQVILNLALNAQDAMTSGGTVTIETAAVEDTDEAIPVHGHRFRGPAVRVAVEDTGEGIPPDLMPRIFEPFFTTKPVGKGTGLGLPMVLGTVEQSGGFIRVQSTPGRGTRFELFFPRVSVLPQAPSKGPGPDGEAPVATPAVTVLVVEDEPEVRRLVARALASAGHEVLEAGGLAEALRAVDGARRPPRLLVTDVRMPDHTGPEVAAAVAARVPGVRTLYVSGYSTEVVEEHGVVPEGVSFLHKPFSPEDLVRKVAGILEAGRATRPGAEHAAARTEGTPVVD